MNTADFNEANNQYAKLYPNSPFFETWVPREKFLNADIDGGGNFLVGREDEGIYGIALGPNPEIPENWKSFSIESCGIASLPQEYKAVVEWDCYWSPTKNGTEVEASSASDAEIETFLKAHAPDSSVFPGNDEILMWIDIHEDGKLAAVAALCRWESGRVVISSVTTHSDLRGRGLGKALMEKCLIAGASVGEKYLSLGVRHQNESAQRLYQGLGFQLMHNFTYCERR